MSLFGAIFNHRLTAELTTRLGGIGHQLTGAGSRTDPTTLKHLPAPIHTGLLNSLAAAISSVFVWATFFAVAVPVLAVFIKEIPLRGADRAVPTPATAEDIAAQDATESTALAALE